MNQLVIFSCLLVVSMVAGAPSRANVRKLVDDKPFQVEDCEDVYGDSSEGTCRALFPRYYWSVAKKDCVKDTSGCANTKNNFITKDDCLKVAKPICLTN